jgi:hypothetical protein
MWNIRGTSFVDLASFLTAFFAPPIQSDGPEGNRRSVSFGCSRLPIVPRITLPLHPEVRPIPFTNDQGIQFRRVYWSAGLTAL